MTACAIAAISATDAHAQWQDSYESWRQNRDQRYQQWRVPSQDRGEGIRELVDLFGGDAEPGQYDVRLPLGINLRVNVDEERPEYEGGRAPHTIDAVITLAANIRQSLSIMHSRARRFGSPEMENRIAEALNHIERVLGAANSGASLASIRSPANRFDRTWHDLESYLRSSDQIDPRFRRQLDQISDYDARLHRTISIAPSHGYDRVQAVAVARRIQQQTERLLSDLENQARPGAGVGRVLRNVRDAHQQAEDVYRAIRQGESYEAVREEYRQFDRAWHETVDVARGNPNLSRRVWRQGQEIYQLDTRMHDILQVESPMSQGKSTWVDRSRSLAKSAQDLSRYIRNSDMRSRGRRQLGIEAEDVAVAAEDFYQWFEAGNRNMVEARDRVNRITERWRDFDNLMGDLGQDQYGELFDLSQQVEQKLQRLQERFAA